jgi:hypothetical protein
VGREAWYCEFAESACRDSTTEGKLLSMYPSNEREQSLLDRSVFNVRARQACSSWNLSRRRRLQKSLEVLHSEFEIGFMG